jgi:hypothetical protein
VGVQPLPVGEVVHLIQQSLYGWEAGLLSDTDILHFWPVGWDFWGPGVPAEIEGYFRSQFRDDLASCRPGTAA